MSDVPARSRRDFLATAAAATAVAFLPSALRAAAAPASTAKWTVGCFNRPWTKWSFDETLDAVKGAGYSVTGLLTETKDEPFSTTATASAASTAEVTPSAIPPVAAPITYEEFMKVDLRVARVLAAADGLRQIAEIVPGVPIIGFQFDGALGAEKRRLDAAVLLQALGERVKFLRREFAETIGTELGYVARGRWRRAGR